MYNRIVRKEEELLRAISDATANQSRFVVGGIFTTIAAVSFDIEIVSPIVFQNTVVLPRSIAGVTIRSRPGVYHRLPANKTLFNVRCQRFVLKDFDVAEDSPQSLAFVDADITLPSITIKDCLLKNVTDALTGYIGGGKIENVDFGDAATSLNEANKFTISNCCNLGDVEILAGGNNNLTGNKKMGAVTTSATTGKNHVVNNSEIGSLTLHASDISGLNS